MEISEEVQEKLALLKSTFLSEIIIYSEEGDFDFTEYLNFDHQIEQTIAAPDEIWNFDKEVQVYRKHFATTDMTYSQIVLSLKETKDNPLLIILNFVTKSESLAQRFCRGERELISTHH